MGDMIEFWGFKRVHGRVWTLLFLSSSPLSAARIGSELQLSTGSVSMALNEMEHWGFAHRISGRGHRQHLYAAETNLWKMLVRVVTMRELHQLDRLILLLQDTANILRASSAGTASEKVERRFAISQLERLITVAECGREAFRIAFGEKPLDLSALHKLSRLRQAFQKL